MSGRVIYWSQHTVSQALSNKTAHSCSPLIKRAFLTHLNTHFVVRSQNKPSTNTSPLSLFSCFLLSTPHCGLVRATVNHLHAASPVVSLAFSGPEHGLNSNKVPGGVLWGTVELSGVARCDSPFDSRSLFGQTLIRCDASSFSANWVNVPKILKGQHNCSRQMIKWGVCVGGHKAWWIHSESIWLTGDDNAFDQNHYVREDRWQDNKWLANVVMFSYNMLFGLSCDTLESGMRSLMRFYMLQYSTFD